METVVVNLRSTIVLLASMLGFAAQAAAYVPLPGADREVAEVATEDVYRTPAAPAVSVERSLVVEARDVRSTREERHRAPTSLRETLRLEREPAQPRLAAATAERRPDRHAELTHTASGREDLATTVTPRARSFVTP